MNPLKTVDISTQHKSPQRPEAALLAELSCFQRLLLVTDGTVTEMLEQYLQESIQVHKLAEKVEKDVDQLPVGHELFVSAQDMPVLKRQVLLQGKTTQQFWLHAESSVLLDHLPQGFRSDLLHSRQPIGRLWEKYKTETYKVMLKSGKLVAGKLAAHFGIRANDVLITRTYGVYSNQKLIMVITENFPASYFKD